MKFCDLPEATHFYIVNYDEQVTIVERLTKSFMFTENIRQDFVCFVNRYMTYYLDKNEVVRLSLYNYGDRIKTITNP